MDVSIERQDGAVVAFTIEVDAEGVERAVARVYRQHAKDLSVPGFRKGKVPRQILERYLSREAATEQAIEDLANEGFRKAIAEHRLAPVDRATMDKADTREDGSVVIQATVPVRPEVTLGAYKGLKATKAASEVTDEHVDAEIDKLRTRHAEYQPVEGRGVEQGDLAIVDCALLIEGEPQEQGSANGYPLEVGTDTLFPELNESLIGAQVGEERRVPVSYPEDFHREEWAGKSGEFVVTVQQLKARVLPELTDEFVAQHTTAKNVLDLRVRVRSGLQAVAEAVAESNLRAELVGQVVEASQVEVPAEPVAREVERRGAAAEQELEERGGTLEGYLARRGMSEEGWLRSLEIEARNDVRRALVMDAIGRAEGLEPSDEEMEPEIAALAQEEGRTPEQMRRRLERSDELDRIANRVYHRKIMDYLVEHAEVSSEAAPGERAPEAGGEDEGGPAAP